MTQALYAHMNNKRKKKDVLHIESHYTKPIVYVILGSSLPFALL
jgi:hypothetical protein